MEYIIIRKSQISFDKEEINIVIKEESIRTFFLELFRSYFNKDNLFIGKKIDLRLYIKGDDKWDFIYLHGMYITNFNSSLEFESEVNLSMCYDHIRIAYEGTDDHKQFMRDIRKDRIEKIIKDL